ncbi:MAG: hypothetical protein GHCLOJNM_00841 [bacterium]|nr:hypothetical protein [bacterium]
MPPTGLPVIEAVRKIADQIGVGTPELSVHHFATFSVVEHAGSGRNWVLAKPSTSMADEGWKLASVGGPGNPTTGAIGTPGADVAVVEVSPEGVGSEPKLLSELDAPDQVAMAEPPSDGPYIGASMEPPVDPGPAVIPSGFVQFGGTYHSNVHLTDEEVDFDLVRHADTDTEIDDFIYQAAVGLRLDLNPRLAQNTYFEYVGALDFFDSETGENRWRHSLEFNTRGESGELIDLWWRGGIIFHDQLRQDEAEYLAQDYTEFWVTPGLDFFLSDKDTLSLSTPLFYRNVSKDGLPDKTLGPPPAPGGGDLPPAQGGVAPKSDIERYADHVGFGVDGTWRRRFSESLETRLRVAYLRRQYDRPALDEYGSIFGCDSAGCTKEIYGDRQDDLFETSLGYTWVICPETAMGMSYRFRNNASNGDFYDFYEHGLRLVANHTLFHGRWCEANLSLVGDVAWRTWRARKADTLNTLVLPPISGPDGLLTPGYDEDTRDDLTYIARLGFDRQFGSYTIGTFYQFEANDSNDGSGDYKDHGVGGFVRLEY